MPDTSGDSQELLRRSLESGRLHSAYLLSGPGEAPRDAALAFVRGLVCSGGPPQPCDACPSCRRSTTRETIQIDGTGRSGPLLRHVGDHPDLLWVERGQNDTRVRIAQIRALQAAFRLCSNDAERRAAVIADAEWLNLEAQNALLRLLEEPPPRTALVLVTSSSAGLLATVRSRCQKLAFRPAPVDPLQDPDCRDLVARLDALGSATLPELLDWAQEYRGARAPAAEAVGELLEISGAWLRARVVSAARQPRSDLRAQLNAHRVLSACRKTLVQRNANPQMVAERALLTLRQTASR